jgi:hypothetical protein
MSKGPEAKLWQDVRKGLKEAHLVRIESRIGLGIPDVNGCINGKDFWLELKVIKGNSLRLSKFQYTTLFRSLRAGGNVFVLARPLSGSVLKVYDCRNVVTGPGFPFPVLTLEKPYDWSKLISILLQRPRTEFP